MFSKVLIANRGEIALRVIRTCQEMGIGTVAVYSTADADSLPVRLADESVHVGQPQPRKSYLNVPNIIGAARRTGADAIHPGYGFLSEDADFARICADHGITFIGPPPEVMEVLGDKASTRRVMETAGLPLLPGTVSPVASSDEAVRIANDVGFPVVLKATAGGGGMGITAVRDPTALPSALTETRATARTLFRNPAVYLEKYLRSPRHVEVQIACDVHGGAVHFGERDCSAQRRNQKLFEESPSPHVDERLRREIGRAAVDGAASVGYRGVGTVEFLLDEDGEFWFMEMNPRIQVEHPVTELVTSVDLVREQIRLAAGEALSVVQDDVRLHGHAVECRINAEDPERGFAATPGRLERYMPPGGPGVRVDSHCCPGSTIPPNYDSMIAKLLVWGDERDTALNRARRALAEYRVEGAGVSTTLAFHRRLVDHPVVRAGAVTTDFVERL